MTIKAVVFDLDNTLVSSNINFELLRQEIDCPDGKDLLTHVAETECDSQRKLRHDVILEHEIKDAKSSSLMSGAQGLLDWLLANNMHFGIITRNCREAAEAKLREHKLVVETLITREDFPAKPDPTALFHLMTEWRLEKGSILYVGDHQYDVLTAQNAGCLSCYISNSSELSACYGADLHYPSLKALHRYLKAQ
ncbi:predicted phosphatases [Vibrio maritimus]|uniref:Predicted phosphatases n=1 Tax=Vibrio maritimus TaxID=990268 RepID=A0A090RRZ5_9VIBR|nr:predicted phosphatases [Vibrio maritimus]